MPPRPNEARGPRFLAALIAIAAAVLPPLPASAAAALVPRGPALQDERPQGAESLVVHSEVLNRDVAVDVTWPDPPLPAGAKAAAVYVLDRGFQLQGPSARLLQRSHAMAPAFVVAVSADGPGADRDADLTHAPVGQGPDAWGGGGALFERFLTEELRPLVEARYPVDPGRAVLFGHSLGGLFAAAVLVEHPRAFSGYLIASPSIWAAPGLIEAARRMPPASRPVRVFIGYGDQEPPDTIGAMRQFAQAISAPRTGLDVRETAFEGQNHLSSYLMEAPAGLPFLLPGVVDGAP